MMLFGWKQFGEGRMINGIDSKSILVISLTGTLLIIKG